MIKYIITKASDSDYKEIKTISSANFYKMIKDLQNKYCHSLIIDFDTYYEVDVEIMIYDDYVE